MRWIPINAQQADAPAARYGHVAVTVDARDDWGTELVIVHGGTTKLPSDREAFLDDVVVFQTEQEAWVRPQIASLSPGPRAFHAAAPVSKGFVFFGGQALIPNTASRTTFNDVWSLSVDSWQWKKIVIQSEFQPSPRSLSSVVALRDGRLLMFGGMNESAKALNDLWILDFATDLWKDVTVIGSVPLPRIKQAVAEVDGVIWLYGGETTAGSFFDDLWMLKEQEEIGQWQWTLIKPKPKPIGRSGHAFSAMHDNLIVCFGGHTPSPVYMFFSQAHHYSKELWILDATKQRWVKCDVADDKESPMERVAPTMVTLHSGRLFVFGGRGKDVVFGDCWWLELDVSEVRTPSSHSLSSLASSALPMHQSMTHRSEGKQKTSTYSSNPFLGGVWNMPTLTTKGILSRMTNRTQKTEDLTSPASQSDQTPMQEMTYISNGHGASLGFPSASSGHPGTPKGEPVIDELDALYSYFDIDKGTLESTFASQPDDRYIDTALIAYAQSVDEFHLDPSRKKPEMTVESARGILMNAEAKELKLGNLWLLLADYKRLLLHSDKLDLWNEEASSKQPINTRFLHFTMDTLRLSDLPELLLGYRHLVETL